MTNLNSETFKEKIFDFEKEEDWIFKGDKPAIAEFGASWCGPCKAIGPILEELSDEYEGKVDIYKVDVDENPELSQAFGIQSIPSVLFIPMEGQPQMSVGGIPKNTIEKAIKEVLKVEE
jgi:thioredoxin 1